MRSRTWTMGSGQARCKTLSAISGTSPHTRRATAASLTDLTSVRLAPNCQPALTLRSMTTTFGLNRSRSPTKLCWYARRNLTLHGNSSYDVLNGMLYRGSNDEEYYSYRSHAC